MQKSGTSSFAVIYRGVVTFPIACELIFSATACAFSSFPYTNNVNLTLTQTQITINIGKDMTNGWTPVGYLVIGI